MYRYNGGFKNQRQEKLSKQQRINSTTTNRRGHSFVRRLAIEHQSLQRTHCILTVKKHFQQNEKKNHIELYPKLFLETLNCFVSINNKKEAISSQRSTILEGRGTISHLVVE